MNNNILRTEKVKSKGQITQAAEHNFRLRTQSNIDDSRTPQNCLLVNSLGVDTSKASDLQEKLSAYYKSLGIKEKSDNVLMMEFVVSASPEWFEKKSPEQINKWADHQVEFFQKKFGDQLKIGILHLDEKTPHLHFMIGTEQKTVKRYKNQKGEFFKETWSLNAYRYNPKFLTDLHTEHAQHNKVLGLKRGVEGSMRKHIDLKEFYKVVNKALSTDYQKQIEKTLETLETGILSKKVSIEEVREKFAPMINGVLKQNKALREKYKLELQEWAQKLAEEKKLVAEEAASLAQKREVYSSAINRMQVDARVIQELESENILLKNELSKYKPAAIPHKPVTEKKKSSKSQDLPFSL